MRLLESHARSSAVLVDKFDAGAFKTALYDVECGSARLVGIGLQLAHGNNSDPGPIGKLLLAPVKKAARCPALFRCDHTADFQPTSYFVNSVENRLTNLMCRL
jgi:hypothetical protein